MATLSFVVLSALLSCALAGYAPEYALPAPVEVHALPVQHYAPAPIHHIAIPPAISTVSFVSLNPHNPTSYSGFTNHGRGHLNPGYAVQYRQDGYDLPREQHVY